MTPPSGQSELKGAALLKHLLAERNQFAEKIPEIDATIVRVFEKTVAILVLDMVGFSRLSEKHGIIFYLSMIAQMDAAARPAVVGNGGTVVKQEADNLFAVFPSATEALEGALDILRAFRAVNGVVPEDRDIFGSIGIGFGSTLLIEDEDLFGCEVNFASKLGEDIAGASEILLTKAAHEALSPRHYRCDPVEATVGGRPATYYHFRAKLDSDGRDIVDPVVQHQASG